MARKRNYVLCIKNDDYPASLEVRKVYRRIPDAKSQKLGLMRVVDESGEDYLYPAQNFVTIELPQSASDLFGSAA